MVERKNAMLELLLNNEQPISIKEIALKIGTSEKTVRNYLKELNYGKADPLVEKIGTRYFLTLPAKKIIQRNLQATTQQLLTNEERGKYILNKLLTENVKKATAFDFAEELFISFSTFKNVIAHVNKKIDKYNLKIISRNNELLLDGTTKNKHQLFADIIHNEAINSLYSIDQLVEYFDPTYVNAVKTMINEYIITEKLVVNELAHFNILVHFLIILDSAYHGKTLDNVSENLLSKLIYKYLLFVPSISDQKKLTEIIALNSSKKIFKPQISKELKNFTHELITEIQSIYSINLSSDNFYDNLLLHLNNLVLRESNGNYARNPLKNTIIQKSPVIFDIATSCAIIICNHYDWKYLPEDEIAYLALHIGMELSRSSDDLNKIHALILIPDYSALNADFIAKIQSHFEDELIILKQNSLKSPIDFSAELIISCTPINSSNSEVVLVSPFLTTEDLAQISQAIEKIYHERSLKKLQLEFNKFFSADLFHIYETEDFPKDKFGIIEFLCDELIELGIVDRKFLSKVLEREKMASTAFKKIAIPHQFTYSAKKSVISVVVSKDGIDWSDKSINLILLTCIADEDRKEFNQFYEVLLEVFANEIFLDKLFLITSFEKFKKLIGAK